MDNKKPMMFLANVKHVPESMQLSAIRQNVYSLLTIRNPTKRVLLEAVDIDPFIIKSMINPDKEIQMRAISNNGKVIQYIKNPSIEIQNEAVKLYGYEILQYIENIDENLQIAALENDIKNIDFIKNLSEGAKDIYDKIKDNFLPEYYKEYKDITTYQTKQYILFDNNVDDHINYLCKALECKNLYLAVGFLFNSGLKMIEKSICNVTSNNGKVSMIIGSLQKYFTEDYVTGMNIETAQSLNKFLDKGVTICTYTDAFYHGKVFIIEGQKLDAIIMGSSNISSSGFKLNKEMNMLWLCGKGTEVSKNYFKWYQDFESQCKVIEHLEDKKFSSLEQAINIVPEISVTEVDTSYVKNKMSEISDEQLLKRLTIWLSKNPDNQYIDLGVVSLNNYVLFEYKDYDLLVLESVLVKLFCNTTI